MSTKIVPKSLHTVTVLVVMAEQILKAAEFKSSIGATLSLISVSDAVYKALDSLGYPSNADFYGLADMAIKKLNKQVKVIQS